MATTALVDRDIAFGREVVSALDQEPEERGLRPTAAFWLLFPDEAVWRLILTLPALREHQPQEVYRELVLALNRRVHDLAGPIDAIGLAPPDHSIARLLAAAIRTPPDALEGVRFSHNAINGELIEDAFIYRLPQEPAESKAAEAGR